MAQGVGRRERAIHDVQVGTADPRGADMDADPFSCRSGNLHEFHLTLTAANGLHGMESFRLDIRGKVPDEEPSPG